MLKSIAQKVQIYGRSHMNGCFTVQFPLIRKFWFYGAPFMYAGEVGNGFKVKCATEQPGAADFTIPSVDFGVPTDEDMLKGVEAAIIAAFNGQPVFAGCMGGIGRTGTFLSVVLKVLQPDLPASQIVSTIRQVYLSHAVETKGQKELIERIDVSALRRKIKWLWLAAVWRRMRGRA